MATPNHLLNTSWTSHRLSPLHHSKEHASILTNLSALQTYATRLRDHLTNSFADAQGYRADEDLSTGSGLATIGTLQSCTWEPVSTLSFLNPGQELQEDQDPAGLLITLSYETTTYKAALLAPPTAQGSQEKSSKPRKRTRASTGGSSSNSTYLPLLLTKLPKPLRESFLAFLSANFDAYVSVLKISSAALCEVLEGYVSSLTSISSAAGSSAEPEGLIEDVIREMHLTLAFAPPIAPLLKTLNVNVPRETFGKFLRASESDSGGGKGRSVLSGLTAYLQEHLALDVRFPVPGSSDGSGSSLVGGYVKLTRVACSGFVVTGEGRVKVVAKGLGEGEGKEEGDERNRGALRGGEALLRALLGRAVAGVERGGES
ncbi:kinetochore complex Sim4 subunit Fta1-domain-containing protein [Aspergillus spectabilis]